MPPKQQLKPHPERMTKAYENTLGKKYWNKHKIKLETVL